MAARGKRRGTLVLWIAGFVFLAIDYTDKLQQAVSIVPDWLQPLMPFLYGLLFVSALLLLDSAHKDDLEELEAKYKQPSLLSLWSAGTDGEMKLATGGVPGTTFMEYHVAVMVTVSGTVEDLKVRVDGIAPDISTAVTRFPHIIRPEIPQVRYHEGDKVYFKVLHRNEHGLLVLSDDSYLPDPRSFQKSRYTFWITAVATGSAPVTERFRLDTRNLDFYLARHADDYEGDAETRSEEQ